MSEVQPFESPNEWLPPTAQLSPVTAPTHQPSPQASYVAHPYHPGFSGTATDQRPAGTAVVLIAWIVAVVTLGYMLPWAIAATRGRSNQGAIGVLDLLLGWTPVGWIVALVMACQSHQVVGHGTLIVAQNFTPIFAPAAGWYPAPDGYGRQYWDGTAWTAHRAP